MVALTNFRCRTFKGVFCLSKTTTMLISNFGKQKRKTKNVSKFCIFSRQEVG
jgi:hypothetical protein